MDTARSDHVLSYGVDAVSGGYLGDPISAQMLADSVKDAPDPNDETEALRKRAAESVPNYAVRAGIDPTDLASAGWGVIFARECPTEIIAKLAPLRSLRRDQAGARYREYIGDEGYRPDDTVRSFLARHRMGTGSADPEKVPYYLLLVGSPSEIPFAFQYRLDVQYAVGRLWFEEPGEYERYAVSVVHQEDRGPSGSKRVLFFAPSNRDDPATALSHEQLVSPLATRCSGHSPRWSCTRAVGEDATKDRLAEMLCADEPKHILFSASHGVGFPNGHAKQRRDQGALVCQEWPGPHYRGLVPDEWYFGVDDIAAAKVEGLIAFLFACYGAGTPKRDYFPEQSRVGVRDIAPADFLASLPRRMLGHPNGSALAVVGHVERAWTWSFWSPDLGAEIAAYEDALDLLMSGHRIGFAMEQFGQRYSELGSELADIHDVLRSDATASPEPIRFSALWTARNDARSFIILGDPAVRIA